jgi:hypothetical protein
MRSLWGHNCISVPYMCSLRASSLRTEMNNVYLICMYVCQARDLVY